MTQKRPKRNFVAAGSLLKLGWFGRLVRLVFGILILVNMPEIIASYGYFTTTASIPDNLSLWVFTAILFWNMNHVINLGLGVNWGRKPQWVSLALLCLAILLDLSLYGHFWAMPLGLLYYLWFLVIALSLGVAFVLSALLATPGCEMRSYADLFAKLTDKQASEHYCPGGIDVVDKWKARFKGAKSDDT